MLGKSKVDSLLCDTLERYNYDCYVDNSDGILLRATKSVSNNCVLRFDNGNNCVLRFGNESPDTKQCNTLLYTLL